MKVRVVLSPAVYPQHSRGPLPSGTVLCGEFRHSSVAALCLRARSYAALGKVTNVRSPGPGRVLNSRTELRLSASSRRLAPLVSVECGTDGDLK
jgi:hypothetical protein